MKMSIEEINSKIAEIDKEINILKQITKKNSDTHNAHIEKIKHLVIELSREKKLFNGYKDLLGFALPDELDSEGREKIEKLMPILEERIEIIKKTLSEIVQ